MCLELHTKDEEVHTNEKLCYYLYAYIPLCAHGMSSRKIYNWCFFFF